MTSQNAELRLVQRMIAGDRNAWANFVHSYQGLVYARIERTSFEGRRRLGTADVEDLCAEVFAGLLKNDCGSLKSFQGRSSLATWLSVIARRACLRHLAKPRFNTSYDEAADVFRTDPAGDLDNLGRLIREEDKVQLRAAMKQLNGSDRQILSMFYLNNLGYAEISRRMNISINTVGPKLHRAQNRLRRLLRHDS